MVACDVTGNISTEGTTQTGNIFYDTTQGIRGIFANSQ